MDVEGWVAVVTAAVAALGWLFRLEGRISGHEQVCSERQNTLASKLNEIKATTARQDEKLDKQDAKLDRLVEHLLR